MKLKSWKKKGTLVTSVVLTAVILGACGSSGAKDDKKSETASKIKLSAQTNISYMDSRLATDESSIQTLNQTNEGLYTYDLEGKLIPAAAKEKAQTNKDKTVYTFTLRDDAKWSNDKPVTAEDFVYAWKSAVDPKTGSQYSYLYDGVVKNATAILGGKKDPKELGIKAVDDKKIEVTLEKPVPYFESLLAFSVFFPLNEIGTSFSKIETAINKNSASSIYAFYDLGSAKMNLEMVAELSDKNITIYDTALVEGAYTAAALLATGASKDIVEEQLKPLVIK